MMVNRFSLAILFIINTCLCIGYVFTYPSITLFLISLANTWVSLMLIANWPTEE